MTDPTDHSWFQRLWHRLAAPATPTADSADAAPPVPDGGIPSSSPALQSTPDVYRQACARHLYQRYANRIYAGQLPPLLHAIAVLELYLDAQGQIEGLHWMREPGHAPEVVTQIEDLVYGAAPFPAPPSGTAAYTETWLWDASGQFQLHTLTEGQL